MGKSRPISSFWDTQTNNSSVTFRVTLITFPPHSHAQFERQQVVLTMSAHLKTLGCCCVPGRLDICVYKELKWLVTVLTKDIIEYLFSMEILLLPYWSVCWWSVFVSVSDMNWKKRDQQKIVQQQRNKYWLFEDFHSIKKRKTWCSSILNVMILPHLMCSWMLDRNFLCNLSLFKNHNWHNTWLLAVFVPVQH